MRRLLSLLTIALLVALGSPAQQAPRPSLRQVWHTGETMEMTLSWLMVVGGKAVIQAKAEGQNRYRFSSLATSNAFFSTIFKVRDEIESVVEGDSLSTLQYHKALQERSKYKEELTVVDPTRNIAVRKGKQVAITRPIYDPLSIIFLLRTLDLSVGKKYSFNILADGKVYPVEAVSLRSEMVTTEAGTFRTVLVEPKMAKGGIFRDENSRLLIWFSEDERHIPVRIRSDIPAGSITATLRAYRTGTAVQTPPGKR